MKRIIVLFLCLIPFGIVNGITKKNDNIEIKVWTDGCNNIQMFSDGSVLWPCGNTISFFPRDFISVNHNLLYQGETFTTMNLDKIANKKVTKLQFANKTKKRNVDIYLDKYETLHLPEQNTLVVYTRGEQKLYYGFEAPKVVVSAQTGTVVGDSSSHGFYGHQLKVLADGSEQTWEIKNTGSPYLSRISFLFGGIFLANGLLSTYFALTSTSDMSGSFGDVWTGMAIGFSALGVAGITTGFLLTPNAVLVEKKF